MQTLAEIRELLDQHGLNPKKSLGQNFLTDHNLIRRLVEASGVGPGDLVLEVGPGTGTLTEELLERGCDLIACELDDGLAALNQTRLGARFPETFQLIHADVLHRKRELNPLLLEAIGGRPFTMVANLPYGCGTPLMLTLLTQHPNCLGMHVTVQLEVADRLVATPAQPKAYGSISVVTQALADAKRIAVLPGECFWPRPDVTSAMISVVRSPNPLAGSNPESWVGFADLVAGLFQTRRKQLGSSLKRLGHTVSAWPDGIASTDRPEALHPAQFVLLARAAGLEIG